MTLFCRILIIFLCSSALFTSASANQKNDEATALLKTANNLSNIRSEGAPSFVLKTTLMLTNDDGGIVQGTYTEYWQSNSQWRKDLILGNFRRTEVAVGRKHWIFDSTSKVSDVLRYIGTPFDLNQGANAGKAGKLRDQVLDGTPARCFRTKAETWGASEFCFDQTTGDLLLTTFPYNVKGRTVDYRCMYREYQKFGEHRLPTSYQCMEDKIVRVEGKLVELRLRAELDQELFVRPPGSKESSRCLTKTQPPKLVYQVEPTAVGTEGVVTIGLSVGTDGKPRDIRVIDSLDASSDKAAVEAIQQWRFTPATCDGEPFEAEIAVESVIHRVH